MENYHVPINSRNRRLEYKERRKKQLSKVEEIENKIEEDDLALYDELEPYRKRANDLLHGFNPF